MHTLFRGTICTLALTLTGVCASVYLGEYAPGAKGAQAQLRGQLAAEPVPVAYGAEGLDLSSRLQARAKMSPQVAALAAAGDRRVLRLTVEGDPARLGLLGGTVVQAPARGGAAVVDLPGRVLDRFALQPAVERVSLLGVVARP